MSFDTLLGNEQLKTNLARSIAGGHISHFYLISGPKGSGKHTLAKLLAAAILCQGEGRKPCLDCHPCRKVMEDAHPDFITIDDPDKVYVPVDLVRDARADMFIMPNESEYKIYLFPRAQDMQAPAQNALLKILEEPPAYGVYILLTDNAFKLLPTVRSRCTELRLNPLNGTVLMGALQKEFPKASEDDLRAAAEKSGGFLGQAKELMKDGTDLPEQTKKFAEAFARRDSLLLLQTLVPMERMKRDAILPLLESWHALMGEAMLCRGGMQTVSSTARMLADSRSTADLRDAAIKLKKIAEYAAGNVSPAAICGYLVWALR